MNPIHFRRLISGFRVLRCVLCAYLAFWKVQGEEIIVDVTFFGRSFVGITSSNSARGVDSVPCEYCLLSSRGLRDKLIPCLEDSYRLWCPTEGD